MHDEKTRVRCKKGLDTSQPLFNLLKTLACLWWVQLPRSQLCLKHVPLSLIQALIPCACPCAFQVLVQD